jgi:uncharacterized protein
MPIPHLTDHPEDGPFAEIFRSQHTVRTDDSRQRSALTPIYFQLKKGETSRFHRVASDAVWNLYRDCCTGPYRHPSSCVSCQPCWR